MDITNILSLLGGLALFLYGMQMMSGGLEAAAGNKMKQILEKLTANRFFGSCSRCSNHSSYSVIFCNYSYGCRIRKFRYDDVVSGCLDYHGC